MDYKTSGRLSSHQAADCLASNVKVSARTLINHSAAAAHKQREVGGLRGGGKGKKKKKKRQVPVEETFAHASQTGTAPPEEETGGASRCAESGFKNARNG